MNELTNLLPFDRAKKLSQEYLVRLLVIALVLATLLLIIHGILLAPSYLFNSEEAQTRKAHLEGIASSNASSEGGSLEERYKALSANADALLALTNAPSAVGTVRSILALPRGGVSLRGIALTFSETGEGTMRLSGIAPTRESLRNYHAALTKLPGVTKAELPLSVYADEADLSFLITLTGTFAP